jgi:2-dehydropantoate 2-reductase
LEVQEVGDLQGLIWGKLAINAGINPLTALLQVINGELLERPDAKHLMARAAKEVAAVAVAKGIKLSPQDAETQILEVAWRTAKNRSSMYQDVLRGAPTEIDVICGAVVREGRRLRIPTPVNEILWRLVRALTHRQEGSEG